MTGLELDRVSFKYGDLWVLRDAELELDSGSQLIVTGDNGVGKSTLLYVCAGLLPALSGRVLLAGRVPSAKRPSDLVRQGVRRGFVFDEGGLLSNMTALANVTLPLRYHADVFGLDEAKIEQRARDRLHELRVSPSDFHVLPAHLSVGVRKRVSLARALAIDPNFVFLDDPDGGLDAASRGIVHGILERLRDNPGITTVITSNSRALMERLGIRVLELRDAHLVSLDAGPKY
jgi:ABC-type transporter Mla maintaining outer membrane lipid asymmetry ATPase subunit MlaF